MDSELLLGLGWSVNLEFVNELGRHRNERLLGPWEEPINCATTEDGRELLGTLSELLVNGREGENHVKIVLDTVEEVGPEDAGGRVFTLLSNLFHVYVLTLDWDEILVFLTEETWNFTGSEHRVDSFKERL